MAQQPSWRGHRAPVEVPGSPGALNPPTRRRRSRLVVVVAAVAAGAAIAGCAALAARLSDERARELPAVAAGTCLVSPDLAQGIPALQELDAISCSRPHDAEVFALLTLENGEQLNSAGMRCLDKAADLGVNAEDLRVRQLEVRPLSLDDTPHPGDTVACFIRHQTGAPLHGAVFTSRD